jgi:hypothetical protein
VAAKKKKKMPPKPKAPKGGFPAEMMDAGAGHKPVGKALPFGGGKMKGAAAPIKPKKKKNRPK